MTHTHRRRAGPYDACRFLLTGVALAVFAGCASPGPTDNPVGRKLTWLSYLNGDDLRPACREGEADRFRMVFNADYNRHVRTYDVIGDPRNGGATLEAHVFEATDIARVDLTDPLSPARGRSGMVHLTPEQFAQFVLRLAGSGVFEPPPTGLRLPSNGIYWLASGCHGGRWFFNAYPYPSNRFADIRFAEPLAQLDGLDVPPPPLPAPEDAPRLLPDTREREGVFFEVQVGRDGLVGPTHLFGPWSLAVTPASH